MTITYVIGDSLYVNLTNRCTNACTFCIRNNGDEVSGSGSLWLEREPTVNETIADILNHKLNNFSQLVFCGYGEPLMRLDDLVEISKAVKKQYPNLPVRVNTNGQAELMYYKGVAEKLSGAVDIISISLNSKNAEEYQKICNSIYGLDAFPSLLSFAADCKKYIPTVILTLVDVIPPEDIEECRKIVKELGVEFRVRQMID